jgi:hypothetical protein
MKKLMLSTLAFFVFAAVALAQNIPAADVAGGYSFIKVVKGSSLTAEGGSGSVALNFNNWLGAVSDFALYHSSVIGSGLAAGTYTFGPRFSYRHWRRITPFTQVLFGGVRYADNGFVFAAGGGADVALDHAGRFALRPQAEYFGFRANGATTNTVRLSIGIVLRLGRKSV